MYTIANIRLLTFPERGLQRNFIYIKDTIIQRQI